jgi:hypothetical protein
MLQPVEERGRESCEEYLISSSSPLSEIQNLVQRTCGATRSVYERGTRGYTRTPHVDPAYTSCSGGWHSDDMRDALGILSNTSIILRPYRRCQR